MNEQFKMIEAAKELIRLAEIGAKWESNSSLEEWFPMTAEEIENLRRNYFALLFAVERVFPGESRHDTALRYIRETEARSHGPCDSQ